jgi:hypothetical protein
MTPADTSIRATNEIVGGDAALCYQVDHGINATQAVSFHCSQKAMTSNLATKRSHEKKTKGT